MVFSELGRRHQRGPAAARRVGAAWDVHCPGSRGQIGRYQLFERAGALHARKEAMNRLDIHFLAVASDEVGEIASNKELNGECDSSRSRATPSELKTDPEVKSENEESRAQIPRATPVASANDEATDG